MDLLFRENQRHCMHHGKTDGRTTDGGRGATLNAAPRKSRIYTTSSTKF